MTVLGVQLVFTVAVASVMQRLNKHISFGQWLFCANLYRYVCPTDEELRQAGNVPHDNKQQKLRRRKENHVPPDHQDTFTIPKSTELTLHCSQLTPVECLPLRFYSDFQWMIDVSLCAVVVYVFTENYRAWTLSGASEFNLSLIWCLFVLISLLKLMTTLTAQYFRSDDFGEGILCCIFGLFFLVLGMGALICEDFLHLGLHEAYYDFSKNALKFLQDQDIASQGPFSLNSFKIILAIVSAILGLCMTFPGIRFARMHMDAVRHASGKPLIIFLLYVNFSFPLALLLLWVKPTVFDHVTKPTGIRPALCTEDSFYTIRLWCTIVFCLLRLSLAVPHLQAHLNMAQDRVSELRREAGRISNLELRKLVLHVYYYLGVVVLQYYTPIMLLLFSCLLMKTLGGLSWVVGTPVELPTPANNTASMLHDGPLAHLGLSLTGLGRVFTSVWYHGLFSYLTFWILVTWSVTSLFGVVYHGQFTH